MKFKLSTSNSRDFAASRLSFSRPCVAQKMTNPDRFENCNLLRFYSETIKDTLLTTVLAKKRRSNTNLHDKIYRRGCKVVKLSKFSHLLSLKGRHLLNCINNTRLIYMTDVYLVMLCLKIRSHQEAKD